MEAALAVAGGAEEAGACDVACCCDVTGRERKEGVGALSVVREVEDDAPADCELARLERAKRLTPRGQGD